MGGLSLQCFDLVVTFTYAFHNSVNLMITFVINDLTVEAILCLDFLEMHRHALLKVGIDLSKFPSHGVSLFLDSDQEG